MEEKNEDNGTEEQNGNKMEGIAELPMAATMAGGAG